MHNLVFTTHVMSDNHGKIIVAKGVWNRNKLLSQQVALKPFFYTKRYVSSFVYLTHDIFLL